MLAFSLSGCYAVFGESIRSNVRETAARDHGCTPPQIQIESDATVGMDYAYWVRVCSGQRRYYRYQQTSTSGVGSGRFIDDTNRFR
jgi:hypothetical protein